MCGKSLDVFGSRLNPCCLAVTKFPALFIRKAGTFVFIKTSKTMANAEHLEILKSGDGAWHEWRDENPDIIPDLSGADLSQLDLDNYNFRKVDLSKTKFNRSSLVETDFSFSSLVEASFDFAIIPNTNFIGADLANSSLYYTRFFSAKLLYANLLGADLGHADLRYSNLSGADFTNAILEGADLGGANLNEAYLYGADLSGAHLFSTTLVNTNLLDCKIGGTTFSFTDLSACLGLEWVQVGSPCSIDFQTLRASRNIPRSFLLKIGLPELYLEYLPDFYSDALSFYPAFLSHSWKNKDFARKLYEALIQKNVNVFFDEKKMKPGDGIYESLSKGIEYYDKMILVCSKESLSESWWVDRELDRVLAKERQLQKERGERINLLIPITIDDFVYSWNGAKAEEIRRYVIGDFREWQDEMKFEKALNELVYALNVDRPDIKPPSFL